MGDPAIIEVRLTLILCYHIMTIDSIPPPCLYLKQYVRSRSVNRRKIIEEWFHVIINLLNLIPDKGDFSDQLEAVKTPDSIGSPGEDGGEVKLCISGVGGAGYLAQSPSSVLSS